MSNVAAGMQTFEWDGRNSKGSAVPAGPLSVRVAAGAPWFFTLFGRDSIWAARMLLPVGVAKGIATFYDWRAKGRAPRCIKLPNGEIRIRRQELDRWLDDRIRTAVHAAGPAGWRAQLRAGIRGYLGLEEASAGAAAWGRGVRAPAPASPWAPRW